MLTRPTLQAWMDKHGVKVSPEAVGEILGLASITGGPTIYPPARAPIPRPIRPPARAPIPTDTRQRICRHPGCRNQPCKVCFDHCTHREK
jgi:hypothetical protein